MRRPPLSEAQVAEINAKRADGARPPLALTVQVRRRLAAKYPSLGKRGLRVIDALEALGGEAAKKELREELHVSAPSLARVLARLEEVGLVRLSHYGAALLLPWRERLEEITPAMPTYGTGARRAYRSACESAAYFEEAQAYAPPERLPYLRRRQAEEAAKRDAYEEAHELHERWRKERADYYADALEHAPPKEQPYLRRKLAEAEAQRDGLEEQAGLHERRRKERARERLQGLHQNARMALVQEAEAVQPALEQEVQRLRYAGTDKAEAQRMLQIAGYAPRAIRRAMQRYWPPLVSREPDLHKVFDSSNWSQKRYTSAARL